MKIYSSELISLNKLSVVKESLNYEHETVKTLKFSSRTGTYLLLPFHHAYQGCDCQQFPILSLIGDAAVIDVSTPADRIFFTRDRMKTFGNQIYKHDMILLYSGNKDAGAGVALSFETVQWLLSYQPKLIGIDAPEITISKNADLFYAICSQNNIPIALNLTNLQLILGMRATVFMLPIPLQGAEACPCNVMAVTNQSCLSESSN